MDDGTRGASQHAAHPRDAAPCAGVQGWGCRVGSSGGREPAAWGPWGAGKTLPVGSCRHRGESPGPVGRVLGGGTNG